MLKPLVLALAGLFLTNGAAAQSLETSVGEVKLTRMLGGLNQPWGVDVLPDGGFLVTERGGALLHASSSGELIRVSGVPKVVARGQGGLLDITVARDFERSREIFLSFSGPGRGGSATTLVVSRLSEDGDRLEKTREIFQASPMSNGGRHFGSRVVEARDGTLFLTLGDRGDRPSAQDLGSHNGSVVRINRNGSVPADNPFVGREGVLPEIWSYGHRNMQGAGLDRAGNLVTVEHGARGGDEVNRPKPGGNFGWPIISYGVHYSGARIGEGSAKPGLEQPEYYWDPSMAPSGLMVYSGKLWPAWRGHIFVGSLKFNYIARLNGNPLKELETIKGRETQRVRDIIEAPDGSIWFISVGQGAVYRMSPEG
ncbi:MAG: PQQ-dependent sugar dehydrogenase [Arenibacterium sp.]